MQSKNGLEPLVTLKFRGRRTGEEPAKNAKQQQPGRSEETWANEENISRN